MTTQICNYINDAPAPGTEISYVPEEVVALGLTGTEKQIAYARDLIANYYRAIEFTAYNIYSHRDGKVLKRVKKDGTVLISWNTKDYTESDLLELRKYITHQIINNEKLHDASIIIDKFRRKCEDSAQRGKRHSPSWGSVQRRTWLHGQCGNVRACCSHLERRSDFDQIRLIRNRMSSNGNQ